MGKSPGKWIKGMLFGKKTTKSNSSKATKLSKSASEKPLRVSTLESEPTIIVDAPLVSNPIVIDAKDNSGLNKVEPSSLPSTEIISCSAKQDEEIMSTVSDQGQTNVSDSEKIEEAAIVVQSSLRSYQARHKFRSLKGIIKMQAIVRGRLVRRQAVATLICVQSIVKFQAVARGHRVRRSSTGNKLGKIQSFVSKDAEQCQIRKHGLSDTMLKKPFINKLLSSTPTAVPLRLQYGSGEPNSASEWLLKWSASQVWAPNPIQSEIHDLKHEIVEMEKIKPKSSGGKVLGNGLNRGNTVTEKLKHDTRKVSSQPLKSTQEHSQIENEKLKCVLKKTSKPSAEKSTEAQVVVEKPKRLQKKLSKSPAPKLSEEIVKTCDKSIKDSEEAVSYNTNVESKYGLPEATITVHEKSGDSFLVEKDFKDDQISNEKNRSSRRNSLPAIHGNQEASPEILTRVPSYMARTASSKAKLKSIDSPRLTQDAADKSSSTRRHSLSSFINGKESSSPRVQRLVQSNGKGGNRMDRSLSSSRDVTDKVIQADWKR